MKVCHFTTVHNRYDTRIFRKQCRSLAKAGHSVTLLVADGKDDEILDGVEICDIGESPGGKLPRMMFSLREMSRVVLSIEAALFHFHDPELIPVGLALKCRGRKVVYDSHEDLPRQILSKPYLRKPWSHLASRAVEALETYAARRFDAIVAVTDGIASRFAKNAKLTILVRNFPSLDDLGLVSLNATKRARRACYIGGLSVIRGCRELVDASRLTRYSIEAAGRIEDERLDRAFLAGFARFVYRGVLGRSEVGTFMAESSVGILTYLPLPNHLEALPTKLFEYMAAGLPVVASDFPLWREIVVGGGCGLCVDPSDPRAIAEAIDQIIGNPEEARRMGEKGRRLVESRYNWESEAVKLVDLYRELEKPA